MARFGSALSWFTKTIRNRYSAFRPAHTHILSSDNYAIGCSLLWYDNCSNYMVWSSQWARRGVDLLANQGDGSVTLINDRCSDGATHFIAATHIHPYSYKIIILCTIINTILLETYNFIYNYKSNMRTSMYYYKQHRFNVCGEPTWQ